jgi:hyperosmotically inducible periplasmic protein
MDTRTLGILVAGFAIGSQQTRGTFLKHRGNTLGNSGGPKMRSKALLLSASLLSGALVATAVTGSAFAQDSTNNSPPAAASSAADNSAQNQRDAGRQTLTPIDQSNKPADLKITRKIRRALVKDRELSTDAKNIKIVTIDGSVTLRGPVKTEQEKADIAAEAAGVAGAANVQNQLEVAGQ